MTPKPSAYPLVMGVLVDAPAAAWLVELLADGRRRARVDGWSLPAEVVAALEALERLSAAHRGATGPTMPDGRVWISTAEAAERLGVSTRRVVTLLTEGKLRGRKRAHRWEVDSADLLLRLPSEPLGTPSESDLGPLCA